MDAAQIPPDFRELASRVWHIRSDAIGLPGPLEFGNHAAVSEGGGFTERPNQGTSGQHVCEVRPCGRDSQLIGHVQSASALVSRERHVPTPNRPLGLARRDRIGVLTVYTRWCRARPGIRRMDQMSGLM